MVEGCGSDSMADPGGWWVEKLGSQFSRVKAKLRKTDQVWKIELLRRCRGQRVPGWIILVYVRFVSEPERNRFNASAPFTARSSS